MVLAFDIYGTLIDPYSMEANLERAFGSSAREAAELWRDKQLEYSFRRGLMRSYVDFNTCTAQALDYVSLRLAIPISDDERRRLLDDYLRLPAFPEVPAALEALSGRGYDLLAFSNGTEGAVRGLLDRAGVLHRFREIVTVEAVRSFKPSPLVYEHLLARAGAPKESTWVISGNPFDVIGAKACGLGAAWVRRDNRRVFDPWEYSPDLTVSSLLELSGHRF